MDTENIIRDIRDLIHDVKTYESNAYHDKKDADRVFCNVEEGEEGSLESYEIVSDGLVEASQALDRAMDRFGTVEGHLLNLIDSIEREALSAKVHSR